MSEGPLYLGFDLSTQQLKGKSTFFLLVHLQNHGQTFAKLQDTPTIQPDPVLILTRKKIAIVIQSDLHVLSEAKVDFDADFGLQYGLTKGVLVNDDEGEVFAPVAMWLEAVDLVLSRLKEKKAPLHRIRGISGACQQHGSVFWNHEAETLLGSLKGAASLKGHLEAALSHPYGPNWQDHSTQGQCDEFDAALGSKTRLAEATGSAAHHVSFLGGSSQ